MQCEIVVREATTQDMVARAELVRHSVTEYDFDAFLLFLLQELTLQVCVLCGAVLFIFVGCGLWACAAVLPGVAAALALSVHVVHRALAATHVARVHKEARGFVAEYRGPLLAEPAAALRPPVRLHPGAEVAPPTPGGMHARVIGTVSLSECWGPRRAGWLHALVVAPGWRRRGAGTALVAAARVHAVQEGLEALEALASELQAAARCLLHAAGWQLRGTYARPVLGAALTLHVSQLALELPHA